MTSSSWCVRASVTLALLCLVFAGVRVIAQDDDARARAVESYNQATSIEREGFEDRVGGPGSAFLRNCQRDCVVHALSSYHSIPSKLAAWRVISCASGIEAWLLTQLAVDAFATLEPAGIAAWTHPSLGPEEIERVRAAAQTARQRVGAVRWNVGASAEVFWGEPGPPLELARGALPDFDTDLHRGPLRDGPVRVGDLLLMPAGTRFSAALGTNGALRRIDLPISPLAAGSPRDALAGSPL